MKIVVSTKELHDKLKMVSKVVGPHKTLPILENYLFDIKNGKLTVTGSNGEGMIQANIELVSAEDGEIKFILDKTLFSALSELSDQPITLDISANKYIVVHYANGKFELQGRNADEFPMIQLPAESNAVSLVRKQVIEGLKTVLPFIANDELRPVMNGVFLQSVKGKLCFVSTDSHCMALREYKVEDLVPFNAIVPGRAAKIILAALLEYKEDNISINVSFKTLSVNTDKYTITYRLIEGNYPKYRSVIPTTHNLKAVVDKNEILSLIRRVSVFSNMNSRLLKFDFGNVVIDVFAQDVDFAIQASETMFGEMDGAPVSIGFNASRLQDVISAIETDNCDIKLISGERACIIQPAQCNSVTLLIMPLLMNN